MDEILDELPGVYRISKFPGMFEDRMRCMVQSPEHAARVQQMFGRPYSTDYRSDLVFKFVLPRTETNILKIKLSLV